MKKPLYGSFFAINQSNDNITVTGGILITHNQIVPIKNPCLDHAFAINFQHEDIFLSDQISRKWVTILDVFRGQDRLPCGHASYKRYHSHGRIAKSRRPYDINRPIFFRFASNRPQLFQLIQMHMNGGRGFEADSFTDFPDTRRISFGLDRRLYNSQYLLLLQRNGRILFHHAPPIFIRFEQIISHN